MLTDPVNNTIRDSFVLNKTITITRDRKTETLIPLRLSKSGDGGLTLMAETVRGTIKPINTKEIEAVIINQGNIVPQRVQDSDLYQESKSLEHETLKHLAYAQLTPRKKEQSDITVGVSAAEQFSPVSGKATEPIPLNLGKKKPSDDLKRVLWASAAAFVVITGLNVAGSLFIR